MKPKFPSERGQAIIMIALAILGLLALTALAVDGGNAYSERRRAQNAADATALDAGLAKVRGQNLYTEGLARAASNGYTDGDPNANGGDPDVEIYNPPASGPYAGQGEYIQVIITAKVKTYFGRVVGITEVTNTVQAVARAKPPIPGAMANGNAIVALNETECGALTYQGNANANVTGGGLFSNSNCDGSGNQSAFFNNSAAGSLTAPCVSAVGSVTYAPGALNLGCGAPQTNVSPLPPIVYPDPTCSGNATKTGSVLSPGNVSGDFPPSGVDQLEPGVYCVGGDFRMTGANPSLVGSNVVIVMKHGGVSLNGTDNVQLSAPTSGPYTGLLLFAPESNSSAIILNGTSSSTFTGTILAPSAPITLNGTGNANAYNSQVIGNTVTISGTNSLSLNYNAGQNYQPPANPWVELVQ